MTKVRHPLFSEIVKDVQDVESWLRAGWVRVGGSRPVETLTDQNGITISHVVDDPEDDE